MIFSLAFTAAGIVFLSEFLIKRTKGCSAEVTTLKSFVSICFIFSAISSILTDIDNKNKLVYGILILSGLIFGMLGDIWLDLKYAHPEGSRIYTYIGFTVFAIGHILYDMALIRQFYGKGNFKFIILAVSVSVLVGVGNIFGEKLLKVTYGEYKAITVIYTMFLVSLLSFSVNSALISGWSGSTVLMIIGAVLFVVSDAILCQTYFGEGKNRPIDIVVNHTTYYFAQFMIALSICFIK